MYIKRDGCWAWIVLLSVIISQVILGGVCISGGIFYMIFAKVFPSDPVAISWLCSLPLTVWFISSPVGSCVNNKYGYRVCAISGGILASTGLSLSFFAPNLTFLFISHGFLTGLGFGLNFTGCMAALNNYFDKYKTMATGLSSIGHNVGMIIFAELILFLDKTYGWRGMMLMLSAITFHLCACACVMIPLPNIKHKFVDSNYNSSVSLTNVKTVKKIENNSIKKKPFLFRKMSFVSFCCSNVFTNIAQGIYILCLPSYSKFAGFTDKSLGTLIMVNSISNIVGKVIFSFLGHSPKANITILYTVSLAFSGVAIGLTPFFLTVNGMLVLAGLVGFFVCVIGALLHAVIFGIVGFERFTDGVGMCFPFKAAGNLIGGPLAGVLLTSTGTYDSSFFIAGFSMVLSSMLMLHPIIHQKQGEKRHQNSNKYTVHEINVDIATKEDLEINCLNHEMEALKTDNNDTVKKTEEFDLILNQESYD